MISESDQRQAITVIQAVLQAIHEKNYTTIPKLVDRSDLPMEELEEFIEETLRLQGRSAIDPYDVPRMFHLTGEDTLLYFYEDEDGEGFEAEYLLTADGQSADMVLAFEFIRTETRLQSGLIDVQPD